MGPYSPALPLDETVFLLLRDLIHERTGLYFDDSKREVIADRLSPFVIELGLGSFLDYYYLLKYDAHTGSEWERVFQGLSIQETYFWREMDQIHAMVDILVPDHLAAHPGEPLRIWSAVCSTGEEPISIAMALAEAGWLDRAPIVINASDANPVAVAKARKGLYRERAFRSLPGHLRARYFIEKDGWWQVAPELHRKIGWATANIAVEADIFDFASSHMIFCRNVFIYFSEKAVRKTVDVFFKRMPSPGYLFVGVSESLFRITKDFELKEIGNAFVYVKK